MTEPTYRIEIQPDTHGWAALIFNASDGEYRSCAVEQTPAGAIERAREWIRTEARKDTETTTLYATEDGELCEAPSEA